MPFFNGRVQITFIEIDIFYKVPSNEVSLSGLGVEGIAGYKMEDHISRLYVEIGWALYGFLNMLQMCLVP
jgi:hypothetical protein